MVQILQSKIENICIFITFMISSNDIAQIACSFPLIFESAILKCDFYVMSIIFLYFQPTVIFTNYISKRKDITDRVGLTCSLLMYVFCLV